MTTKNCLKCNMEFSVYQSNNSKKFCSRECYHTTPKAKGKDSPQFKQLSVCCEYCSKRYSVPKSCCKNGKKNLCSIYCRQLYIADKRKVMTKYIIKNCNSCGSEVKRTEAQFKNSPAKNYYCSVVCKDKNLSLKRGGFTPQIKKCKYCNKSFTICKKNHRYREYCSKKCRTNGFPKGKEHKNFKKELSRDYRTRHRLFTENTVWRNDIFKRDAYTCQVCYEKGNKLNAHHLENYSSNKEKRFDIINGVTLCVSCHKLFHSQYGVVRNTEKQFILFKKEHG